MQKKVFRILSIDGGGIRGIFPAYVLKCVQERLDVSVYDKFSMFAGTSTGAIVAAGIAIGRSPDEIVDLYQSYGDQIFGDRIKSIWPKKRKIIFYSKFNNANLRRVLSEQSSRIKGISSASFLCASTGKTSRN